MSLLSAVVATSTALDEAVRGFAGHTVAEPDSLATSDLARREDLFVRLAVAAATGRDDQRVRLGAENVLEATIPVEVDPLGALGVNAETTRIGNLEVNRAIRSMGFVRAEFCPNVDRGDGLAPSENCHESDEGSKLHLSTALLR